MFDTSVFANIRSKADYDAQRQAMKQKRSQMEMQDTMNKLQIQQAQKDLGAPAEIQLKKLAETALLKQNMGQPLNAQETAAIQSMAQIAPPSYSTDSLGRTIAKPSGWSQLNPSQLKTMPPSEMGQRADSGMVSPTTQRMTPDNLPFDDIAMQADLPMDGLPQDMVDPTQISGGQELVNRSGVANTPEGQKETLKTGLDIIEKEAEEGRKSKRDTQQTRREEDFAFESALQQKDIVDTAINDIVKQVSPYNTGVMGGKNPLSQSGANIEALLSTVNSDSTLGKLVELKKAGGTLGQITEAELVLLGNSRAALQRIQDPVQFIDQLKKYQLQRDTSINKIGNAYKNQFGEYPTGFGDAPKPKQMTAREFLSQ